MTNAQILVFAFVAMGNRMVLYCGSQPGRSQERKSRYNKKAMVVLALFAFSLLLFAGTLNTAASSNSLKEPTRLSSDTNEHGGLTSHNQEDTKTRTKGDKKGASPGQKSEPLKRFVPSQKIEADQAVDFPNDI